MSFTLSSNKSKTTFSKTEYLFILCFFTATILSGQTFSIGHTSATFIDESRNNREIPVEIYYPADVAGEDVDVFSDCFPVISFGHGFLMTSGAYENIRETLVPEGYIMAFVDSETGFNVSHENYGLDLAYVLDELINLSLLFGGQFEDRVCGRNIVMGHSMGGGAGVLAIENSNNINGYIGLAPAETTPSAIAAAANAVVPSLIFSGTSDGVTPPEEHHIPIYDGFNSTCKTIVNITGGAHCFYAIEDFLCDFGEGSASTGITVTRAEQQTIMNDYVIPWLQFLNETEDFFPIEVTLANDDRITFDSNCLTTGVEDVNEIDMLVFPNPTTGFITIKDIPQHLFGEKYYVRNVLGNRVVEGWVNGDFFEIDLESFPAGIYFFFLDGAKKTIRINNL